MYGILARSIVIVWLGIVRPEQVGLGARPEKSFITSALWPYQGISPNPIVCHVIVKRYRVP